MFIDFHYTEPVFRPPSEAYSFIIQVMNGCSQNSCLFCGMYKQKKLYIQSYENLKQKLNRLPVDFRLSVKKIFLGDGDALFVGKKYLFELLELIEDLFPNLNRISAYATANSVLNFSENDFKLMNEKKLRLFYIGLESGSQSLLDYAKKGNTARQFIQACELIHKGNCKVSVTAILGLGGKIFSKEHSIETANVVNSSVPEYFSLLTLIYGGNDNYINSLKLLTKREIFEEMHDIIINIKTIFRSNHASNIVNINGTLQKDKEKMLISLDNIIKQTANIKEYNMPPSFHDERGY